MPFLASTNAVRLQSTKARCAYPTTASFLQRFDIFFVDRWPIGIAGKLRFAAENQPRSVLRFALTCQPRDDPSAFADKDRLAALMHLVNQRKALRLKLGCVYLHLTRLRDQAYFAIKRKRALSLSASISFHGSITRDERKIVLDRLPDEHPVKGISVPTQKRKMMVLEKRLRRPFSCDRKWTVIDSPLAHRF